MRKVAIFLLAVFSLLVNPLNLTTAQGFDDSDSRPRICYFHNGKSSCCPISMRQTIHFTLNALGLKLSKNFEKLILETMIVESGLGIYSKNEINKGILQIQQATAREVLDKMKKYKSDQYFNLMMVYDHNKTLAQNCLYNIPFSIGMTTHIYLMKIKNIEPRIQTLEGRARVWKVHYNTHLGKGSVGIYIKRVKSHLKKKSK